MARKTKTTEQFIADARKVYENKYDYSKTQYVKSSTKVIITCPIHGDWKVTPNNHLRGSQCPKCGQAQRTKSNTKNSNYFIEKARYIHDNKYGYSKLEYITNNHKVIIICHEKDEFGNEHGEFLQAPHDHVEGQCGCPKCKNKGQHNLYNRLCKIFPNEIILYEVNSKVAPWLERQRFNIYFPKYNIAVEYNGSQHYMPIQQFGGQLGYENTLYRDNLKRTKCSKNGCTLIEIKYKYSQKELKQVVDSINNVINNY